MRVGLCESCGIRICPVAQVSVSIRNCGGTTGAEFAAAVVASVVGSPGSVGRAPSW